MGACSAEFQLIARLFLFFLPWLAGNCPFRTNNCISLKDIFFAKSNILLIVEWYKLCAIENIKSNAATEGRFPPEGLGNSGVQNFALEESMQSRLLILSS